MSDAKPRMRCETCGLVYEAARIASDVGGTVIWVCGRASPGQLESLPEAKTPCRWVPLTP